MDQVSNMGKSRKGVKSDGRHSTRLYSIYLNMKSRCYYVKNPRYKNYGARGIKICEEWLNDFLVFKEWAIKSGYSDNLTIDRKNVNGNYEASNCRWITNKEQQNNKTTSNFIEYNGEIKTLQQWSECLGIGYNTLKKRVEKWGIARAFSTPIMEEYRRQRNDKSVI